MPTLGDGAGLPARGPRTGPGRKGRMWTGDMSLVGTTNSRKADAQDGEGGGAGP